MDDHELDELILGRLRHRRQKTDAGELSDATQSAADLAAFFNEPEASVEDRLRGLASEGRIVESVAAPDRWMIAAGAA
jgi:hypothetical protein